MHGEKIFEKNYFFFFILLTFFLDSYIIIHVFSNERAPLAQLVEQWTVNPCVAGSSPAGGA